ncbi:MAG: lipoate--protein ligase family protein [Planctomyces sp.]|nr:lipoate--protein ligase family protein [Planctomyces sp.]
MANDICTRLLDLWPGEVDRIDFSLPTAPDNLAFDEALLLTVNDEPEAACVRFWELRKPAVILGRSNSREKEVDEAACAADGVEIFRRCTGGGTVVAGPGCLMFTVVVPISEAIAKLGVPATTCQLLGRIVKELRPLLGDVQIKGTSDLVIGERKFSGNAQKYARQAILHHGSILYDFDLPLIGRYLRQPSRQPEYRAGRAHDEFVMNVPVRREQLTEVIAGAWHAVADEHFVPPYDLTAQLAKERYRTPEWNA